MEIILHQAQIRVSDQPNGGKVIQFLTPQGIVITAHLDEQGAKTIAAALGTGLIVANGPLPTVKPKRAN